MGVKNSVVVQVDSRGRILIPKRIRERLKIGKRVLLIPIRERLEVIPLPEDPLEILDGAFTTDVLFSELRKEAERQAEEETGK
ncbi:MAG: AbrB family transcriptional regulator [Thermoproteota archaeon]|nr:MAG: AbrB family transcriptional regulator [Candidatus Korarchaeota archaeon]